MTRVAKPPRFGRQNYHSQTTASACERQLLAVAQNVCQQPCCSGVIARLGPDISDIFYSRLSDLQGNLARLDAVGGDLQRTFARIPRGLQNNGEHAAKDAHLRQVEKLKRCEVAVCSSPVRGRAGGLKLDWSVVQGAKISVLVDNFYSDVRQVFPVGRKPPA